jgi:TonB family protein
MVVRASALSLALFCLVLVVASPQAAFAQSAVLPVDANVHVAGTGEILAFDIPAQSLGAAIEAYGAATGLQVLYDARLASGRKSNEIKGAYVPPTAMRLLLAGTGLEARYAAREALIIVPAQVTHTAAPADIGAIALRGATELQRRYYALVQAGIANAFCSMAATRSARFRVAVSFWLDQTGSVARFDLLSSTGDPNLDGAIASAMRRVAVGEPPPAVLVQPFTTVIVPRSADGADCP